MYVQISGTRKLFSVVHFDEGDDVSVVPSSWVIGNKEVKWPPYKGAHKVTAAIKHLERPSYDWEIYKCRVLGTCGKQLLQHFNSLAY